MKKLTALLILFLFVFSLPGCDQILNQKTIYLPLKIISHHDTSDYITEYIYDRQNHLIRIDYYQEIPEGIIPSSKYSRVVTTDQNGNVLTVSTTDSNDIAYSFTYDEAGKLLTRKYIRYNIFQTYAAIEEWQYDSQGRILAYHYKENAKNESSHYQYNEQGQIVTVSNYRNADTFLSQMHYSYDNTGKCTKEQLFKSNGDLLSEKDYVYSGRSITESTYKASAPENVYSRIKNYDKAGNLISLDLRGDGTVDYSYTYKAIKVPVDSPRQILDPLFEAEDTTEHYFPRNLTTGN